MVDPSDEQDVRSVTQKVNLSEEQTCGASERAILLSTRHKPARSLSPLLDFLPRC
jgi:hypothetical protein